MPGSNGTVVRAQVFEREAVLGDVLSPTRAQRNTRRLLVVALGDDQGRIGLGEASPIDWIDGARFEDLALNARERALEMQGQAVAALLDEFRAGGGRDGDVRGSDDPGHAGRGRAGQNGSVRDGAIPSELRCAFETALLDLDAQASGVSLSERLGGPVPTSLPLSCLITAGEPEGAVRTATRALAQGFRCLKLKIAQADPALEAATVRAVRECVGNGVRLRLDANGGWPVAEAEARLRALEPLDIDMIEEPCDAANTSLDTLAQLAAGTTIPFAVDESIVGLADLERVLAAGFARVLVVKLLRAGGPTAALALAARAKRDGLRVVFTDGIESGVGSAAALHTALAAGSSEPVGLGGRVLILEDPVLGESLNPGPALCPASPGLGVVARALEIA